MVIHARYMRHMRQGLIQGMEKGDDPLYRGYCAMALGMIGDRTAIDPLRKMVMDDIQPQIRIQAVLALALMKDIESAPDLLDMLVTSDNDTTKAFIAMSLGFMGDFRVVEMIHERMKGKQLDDLTLLHLLSLSSKLLSGRVAPYMVEVAEDSNFACELPIIEDLLQMGI